MWLNTPQHLIRNHENCIHPDTVKGKIARPISKKKAKKLIYHVWKRGVADLGLIDYLNNFCQGVLPYIKFSMSERNTNQNESLNASISCTAPKSFSLGPSYQARAGIAIGLKNDPKNFIPNLMIATGMTEGFLRKSFDVIKEDYRKRNDEYILRNSPRKRKQENLERIQTRNAYKSSKKGDYNEDKSEISISEEI